MSSQAGPQWPAVGAVASAGTVAATIFCCLPFASGIVGAGVAAFGAQFAPFRTYLIGVSIACLAFALYQTYQPRATDCEDGHCDTPAGVRRRRWVLLAVAAVVVLLLTTSWWANWIIYWTL